MLKKVPVEYGVEVDVRVAGKELILNHEPYIGGELLKEFLSNYRHSFIIFNIKEAGIESDVIKLAQDYNIEDYFLLDVEYPFIYRATRKDIFKKIAVRFSEAEPIEFALAHKGMVDWVWVDTNTILSLNADVYARLHKAGFKIALVSPDRWGRPEDILKYKAYLTKEKIPVDLVMVDLQLAPKWLDCKVQDD
jgi:hypothetical protein